MFAVFDSRFSAAARRGRWVLPLLLGFPGFIPSAAALEGELDYRFGSPAPDGGRTGYSEVTIAPARSATRIVAVHSSGRMVAAGSYPGGGLLVCYREDGTLDSSFAGDGCLEVEGVSSRGFTSVAFQSDGKILAGGMSAGQGTLVFRCSAQGVPDATFGENGWFYGGAPIPSGASDLAVLDDGKIIVAGERHLVRLDAGGRLDPSFGTGGSVPLAGMLNVACTVLPGGKILVADSGIFRQYTSSGILDSAFGSDGKLFLEAGGFSSIFGAIQVQPDGKIQIFGTDPEQRFVSVRLLPDGTPDNTHSPGGVMTGQSLPPSLTLQGRWTVSTDGFVAIPGYVERELSPDETRFWPAVARYTAYGTPALSTPAASLFVADDPALSAMALGAVSRPDGSLCAIGSTILPLGGKPLVIRFLGPGDPEGNLWIEYPPGQILGNGALIDLGTIQPSFQVPVRYRNTGDGRLTRIESTFQKTGGVEVVNNGPPPAMYSGAVMTAVTTFNGTAPGPFTVTFTHTSTDPSDNPFKITFKGVIPDPSPRLIVPLQWDGGTGTPLPPGGIMLGKVAPGTVRNYTLRIRNDGQAPLTGLKAQLTGFTSGFFLGNQVPVQSLDLGNIPVGGLSPVFSISFNGDASQSAPAVRTLRLTANPAETFTVDVLATAAPVFPSDKWRQLYFSSMASTGPSANDADPDGDGLPNLIEYAGGTNPLKGDALSADLRINGDKLEYRFLAISEAAQYLRYTLEWNDHLTGLWSVDGLNVTASPVAGNRQRVTLTIPAGSGKRFVRLRASAKPYYTEESAEASP